MSVRAANFCIYYTQVAYPEVRQVLHIVSLDKKDNTRVNTGLDPFYQVTHFVTATLHISIASDSFIWALQLVRARMC